MSSLDSFKMSKIETRILRDYDSHNPGTVFANGLRLGIEEARRLQAAVANLRENRGEKVIGYKIGCVSEVNQKALGITRPVWRQLWSTEQYEGGVELRKAEFSD
jgi:2-keto-4-pentenoate hydratase